MAPFDAAVMHAEAIAVLVPLAYNFSILSEHHLTRYLQLFDQSAVGESDLNALRVWAESMPGFYHWGGNPRFVERFLQALFGFRFTIQENVESRHETPEALRWKLGKNQNMLGHESVLGKSFSECDTALEVTVHDVPPNQVADLLPNHTLRRKVDEVLSICLPAGMSCRVRVASLPTAGRLAGANRLNRLGYTARLAKTKNDRQMRAKVS
jgi:predicted component of type VI protein secretion system